MLKSIVAFGISALALKIEDDQTLLESQEETGRGQIETKRDSIGGWKILSEFQKGGSGRWANSVYFEAKKPDPPKVKKPGF